MHNDILRMKSGQLGRNLTQETTSHENKYPYLELLQEIQNAFYKRQPSLGKHQKELEQVRNSVDMVRSTYDFANSRSAVMELGKDMENAIRELINSRPSVAPTEVSSPARLSRTFIEQSTVRREHTEEEERIEVINGVPTKVRIIRRTPEKPSPTKVVVPPTFAFDRGNTQQTPLPQNPPDYVNPQPSNQLEIIQLRQKNKDLEDKLARTLEDIANRDRSRGDVMRLNTIYDKQTIEIDDLKRQVSILMTKLNEKDSYKQRATAEEERSKEEAREEIRKLRQQIIELTHKNREEVHMIQVQVKSKEEVIHELQGKLRMRDEQVEEVNRKALHRETDMKDAQKQLTAEMYKQIEVANRIILLEEAEKDAKRRAEQAEDKAFEMEGELKRAQMRIQDLESRIRNLSLGDPSKDARMRQLESQVSTLRQELLDAEHKLERQDREFQAEKLKMISDFDSKIRQQDKSNSNRSEDLIRDLQNQLKTERSAKQNLSDKLNQAEKDLNDAKISYEKRIFDLEDQLKAAEAQNESLKLKERQRDSQDMAARAQQAEREQIAIQKAKPIEPEKASPKEIEELNSRIRYLEKNEADLIDELVNARTALKTAQAEMLQSARTPRSLPRYYLEEIARLRRQIGRLKEDYRQAVEASDVSQETVRVYIQSLRSMFANQLECYPSGTVPNLLDKLRRAEKDAQMNHRRDSSRESNTRNSQVGFSPTRSERSLQKPHVIDAYYDAEKGLTFCSACMRKEEQKKMVRFDDTAELNDALIKELKEHVDSLQEELRRKDHIIESLRFSGQSPSSKG